MSGHIYFLSNPSMPGLLKIGFTAKSLDERLNRLRNTAVPADFEIEAVFRVDAPLVCEQAVHEALNQYRHTPQREFFRLDLKTALEIGWPLIRSHLAADVKQPEAGKAPHPFPDLSETEEEILWSVLNKPSYLALDWSWIRNENHLTENETKFYLEELKAKRYLKELKSRNPQYDSDWELGEKGLKYYMWIEGKQGPPRS